MFPSIDSADRRFAFLHWVLQGEFPSFDGTIKALRLPAVRPTALRFLRLAVPRLHSQVCSSTTECAVEAWSCSPGGSSRDVAEETDRISQVPGEPQSSVCTCSKPTPAGLLTPDHTVQQRGPCSSQGRGSHDWVFRRSIAWLSDSLSTLRDADYSNTTQDSLPVAGQALLDGFLTRKVPMKGFKVVDYILFSFPKLACASDATSGSFRDGESTAVGKPQ